MSSSYHILCVSHDPGVYAAEDIREMNIADILQNGLKDHPFCDLLVLRRSGALVEVGCPGDFIQGRNSEAKCRHNGLEWERVEWLRLLYYTQLNSPTTEFEKLRDNYTMRCWNQNRIQRLRYELGMEEL